MIDDVEREVRGLHAFFERWFRGEGGALERAERALAPDFQLVGPRGTRDDRASILAAIASARGGRSASFRIAVERFAVRWEGEGACLVTYEEHQSEGDERTARLSTALFRRSERAPCGVEWVHLHETWSGDRFRA